MELPVNVLFALIPGLVVAFRMDLRLPGEAPSAMELWESFRDTEPTLGEVWMGLHPDLSFVPADAVNKDHALRYEGSMGYIWVLPETVQALKTNPRLPLLAIGKRRRQGTCHFQSVKHLTDDNGRIETSPKIHGERALSGIRMEFANHVREKVSQAHLTGYPSSVLDQWSRLDG